MNFSRIDNTTLNLHFDYEKIDCKQYELIVYATNYNILRTGQGVGELGFTT